MLFKLCTMVLIITAAGCTSMQLVTPTGREGVLSYQNFNEQVADDVRIQYKNGGDVEGVGFRVERDTATWMVAGGEKRVSAPVSSIHSVRTTGNRVAGGAIGFGIGLGMGGIIGGLIGSQSMSGEDVRLGTAVGMAIGGGSCALLGTLIGVALPQDYEYRFEGSGPSD